MKHIVVTVLLLSSAAFTTPALACEKHAAEKQSAGNLVIAQHTKSEHTPTEPTEERVIHYEIDKPKTVEDAITLLQMKTEEIGAIMDNAKLDGNQMEAIHEKTYSLEAAIDKIRAENHVTDHEAAIDEADEAIQSLHYASENHKQDESREWYIRLEPAVAKIKAALQS